MFSLITNYSHVFTNTIKSPKLSLLKIYNYYITIRLPFILLVQSANDIELMERIGRGTSGVVFRAEWKSKNMKVAVKKMNVDMKNEDTRNIHKEVMMEP